MSRQRIFRLIAAFTLTLVAIALLFLWFGGDPFELRAHSFARAGELIVPFGIAVGVAAVCHAFVRRWFVACILCTAALTALDTVISILTGAPAASPLWVIGIFTIALASFVVAAVVGLVFLLCRSLASTT